MWEGYSVIVLGMYGGASPGQHDPSAALVVDGKIVAVCEEERYVRIKSAWGSLPINSVRECLRLGGITLGDVDVIVHPGETHAGLRDRVMAYLRHYFGYCPRIEVVSHHLAHLASAFYCSGFGEAMCLSYDRYGDRVSTVLARASSCGIEILETRDWENSLGVFYSAITSYLGFQLA